jgi:hypothetical protein
MPRPPLRLSSLLPCFALLSVLAVAACAYGNDPPPPPRSTALPPPSPTAAAAAPAPSAALAAPVPRATPAAPSGPQPVPLPPRGAERAGASPTTIAACRAEAERAAVTRNRGDLMRLEGRDVDVGGDRNRLFDEQVRGFAQQDRDRLFRECLSRADTGSTRIP